MVTMGMSSLGCRNIKLVLGYDGYLFQGWQKQKNTRNTVQELLERALWKILNEKISLVGAGRLDSKAHALRQVANFKTSNFSIPDFKFKEILNGILPEYVRILSSEEVPLGFHSRYSAKWRKYVYFVYLGNELKFPFLRGRYAYVLDRDIDIRFVRSVAKDFEGEYDFLPISSVRDYKTTIRIVKFVRVFRFKDFLIFSIKANGFMYNMARGIVSWCIFAEEKRDPELVKKVLRKETKTKPTLLPACGLYLHRVFY